MNTVKQYFKVPYGKTFKEVAVPEKNILGILTSRKFNTGLNEEEIIQKALENPIGYPRLSELCMNIKKVLLITNDMTRPMPSKITIPAMLKEIGLLNKDIETKIIIASGLHRAMTRQELIDKMGEDIVNNYSIVVHNAYDKDSLVNLGRLKSDNELWVNKEVTEHDLVISEGFIEAHWLAGFSGGRKSIFPGIAGADTVMNNHSAFNVDHPMTRPGVLEGNPVHEEFSEAAKKARLTFILNVVLDEKKQIINAFAGETFKAHEAGCDFVRSIIEIPCRPADIVITSNSGFPLDINLYQSIKGMDTAAAAARDNALIIVSTECSEGVGHGGFLEVLKSGGNPRTILEDLRSKKIKVYDQWGAQVMLKLSIEYTIIVVTENIDGDILRSMFVEHAADLQTALEMAFKIKGQDATVNIIPEGPVIIPKAEL